jgi:hypothetical protein
MAGFVSMLVWFAMDHLVIFGFISTALLVVLIRFPSWYKKKPILENTLIISTILMLLLTGPAVFFNFLMSKVSANQVFKMLIADPIPPNVKILGGNGGGWQGFGARVIFLTNDTTFQQLTADYKETDGCISERNGYHADIKDRVGKSYPEVHQIQSAQCFEKYGRKKNAWEEYYMVWNRKEGKGYFYYSSS